MDTTLQRFYLRKEEVTVPGIEKKVVTRPDEYVPIVRELLKGEVQEVSLAFFLDSQSQLLGYLELARGGIDWVSWDRRLLFSTAILCGAARIILFHNHPSGVARPSRQDVVNMKNLIPAADLLCMDLIDHVVVSKTQHVSMREYGLLGDVGQLLRDAAKKREEALDNEAK